jgi:hypothetical protein
MDRGPTLGIVSEALPPGRDGYTIILEELLRALPEQDLVTVSVGWRRWGQRKRISLPVARVPGRRSESIAAALSLMTTRAAYGALLSRRYPQVRRIFATLDPTLGVASAWAAAARAELWVYAIDLHTSSFWGAGTAFRGVLRRWHRAALRDATRMFALSEQMAEWLRGEGANGPVAILPPLIDVPPEPSVGAPNKKPIFLFCGWVYSAHQRALSWIEQAADAVAPEAELRLVTPMTREHLAALGVNLGRWTVLARTPAEIASEVAACTCAIVALDPEPSSPELREALKVAVPTKVREYLSVGKPVLCVAAPDYAIARLATEGRWGQVCSDQASTQSAVKQMLESTEADLAARGRAAHRFALERLNNGTVGASFRRELAAPRTP